MHGITKVSEPRLFSVLIISLGTDADEVITEAFTLTYQARMLEHRESLSFRRKTRWQQL